MRTFVTMNRLNKCTILIIFFSFLNSFYVNGQETKISVEIGERTFSQQKPFTLTVKAKNSEQYPECKFPEITGFKKRGVSRSTATATVAGKPEITQSIVQEYIAVKAGTFKVPPQTILVNNIPTKTEAFTLNIAPSDEANPDVFDDLFWDKIPENINAKADAFLSLNVTKSSVYVGEGFAVTLSFYVAKNNAVEMQFYDLDTQIPEILKKVKPLNCWEENFGITEPQISEVNIKGKVYDEYRLYQAVFFPINNQPIIFSPVGLNMLNFKPGKSGEKLKVYQTFSTQSITVLVEELPTHPRRNEATVGAFHLEESIGNNKVSTGKSFQYDLHIGGDGNISTIKLPDIQSDSLFDFYPPDVKQTINRHSGKISGDKLFSFQIIQNKQVYLS